MGDSKLILVRNAKIWISGQEDSTWMLLNEETGRVITTGSSGTEPSEKTNRTVDMQGARILPGIHESHIHVGLIGQTGLSLDLKNCATMDELKKRLGDYVKANPDATWIRGMGWEQDKIGRYPTREDLDEVCAEKPVFLNRVCMHVAVMNSKALQLAGIDRNSPVPEGGGIDRFPDDHPMAGEPTGMLRESPVLQPVEKLMQISSAEKLAQIKYALQMCLDLGCTAVHSMEFGTWNEYASLARSGDLPIRVFFSAAAEEMGSDNFPAYAGEEVRREGINTDPKGAMLSCDRVKVFSDGALGAATAALSENYKNQTQKGLLIHKQETLTSIVSEMNSAGYRLEIHTIGDRSAEACIVALEQSQVSPEKRPILTHCQILREDLADRMNALGAIANIQPQFVTTDSQWVSNLLPDSLLPWAYAWKSLLKKGVHCAGGSDAPVELPNPLVGIYDAIFRPLGARNPENQQTFKPSECLSVREAIDLYTISGAYATRREHDLGQLLPGYFADFTVLDCDPVENPKLFLSAKVTQVWVNGERKK